MSRRNSGFVGGGIMFNSDFEKGFPEGTFDIDDKVYHVSIYTHRFNIPNDCPYCNNTGYIEFKGKIFNCPECNGYKKHVEVKEMVIDEKVDHIKSKITMLSSENDSREIYYTDNFLGIMICLNNDGQRYYFRSKDEAKQVCDEFNTKNNVFEQLRFYKEKEMKSK